MTETQSFVAVDLGASSGRVMVGRVRDGELDLTASCSRPGCGPSPRITPTPSPTGTTTASGTIEINDALSIEVGTPERNRVAVRISRVR